jgi:transposase InsO family protein
MHKYASELNVERMAKLLGVSTSGYYEYIKFNKSTRAQKDQELLKEIEMIHTNSRQTYGSPRIHESLKQMNYRISRKRVIKLMQQNGIKAKMTKFYKVTTKVNHKAPVAPNILQQVFTATKPNQKWVSDITYIRTNIGWLYLAVVMDLFSRKIIGMAMNNIMTKDLVIHALKHAINDRGVPDGLIYHSDKGSQYTSYDFQQLLKAHSITSSMSGTGNCYDNAAMESFFHTLKTECVYFERYDTFEDARSSIFEYIQVFYNRQRIHSFCGYITPHQLETRHEKLNGRVH